MATYNKTKSVSDPYSTDWSVAEILKLQDAVSLLKQTPTSSFKWSLLTTIAFSDWNSGTFTLLSGGFPLGTILSDAFIVPSSDFDDSALSAGVGMRFYLATAHTGGGQNIWELLPPSEIAAGMIQGGGLTYMFATQDGHGPAGWYANPSGPSYSLPTHGALLSPIKIDSSLVGVDFSGDSVGANNDASTGSVAVWILSQAP